MYYNSENEGLITKDFLKEVIEYDRKECSGHYLIISGFVSDFLGEEKNCLNLETIINYMWRENYKYVSYNTYRHINWLNIVFEVR